MILCFNWYGFSIGFYSFTCWSFSGYASSIVTLGGFAGEFAFTKISARYLNASLCVFPWVNIGLVGSIF